MASQAMLVPLTSPPPPAERGSILAFHQVFVGVAAALVPAVVATLLDHRPALLWWVLLAAVVLVAAELSALQRSHLPAAAPTASPCGRPGPRDELAAASPCTAIGGGANSAYFPLAGPSFFCSLLATRATSGVPISANTARASVHAAAAASRSPTALYTSPSVYSARARHSGALR